MTAKEYIIALRQNNQLIFSRLYESYRALFFGYFRKHYNKDDDYIIDLYQDACIALWQNVQNGKLTPDNLTSSLETYLIGIGKYTLMAKDRKYKEILNEHEIAAYTEYYDEESLQDEIECNEIIETTVKNMGEPCCTLLDKYYWEELSGDEIAILMNYKNADTVKTQKYKCMQKLKTVLVQKMNNHKLL